MTYCGMWLYLPPQSPQLVIAHGVFFQEGYEHIIRATEFRYLTTCGNCKISCDRVHAKERT